MLDKPVIIDVLNLIPQSYVSEQRRTVACRHLIMLVIALSMVLLVITIGCRIKLDHLKNHQADMQAANLESNLLEQQTRQLNYQIRQDDLRRQLWVEREGLDPMAIIGKLESTILPEVQALRFKFSSTDLLFSGQATGPDDVVAMLRGLSEIYGDVIRLTAFQYNSGGIYSFTIEGEGIDCWQ